MNERLGMMADICPACEGKPVYPNNPCQVCGTSYVAPPEPSRTVKAMESFLDARDELDKKEPSLEQVIAVVRAKYPQARVGGVWGGEYVICTSDTRPSNCHSEPCKTIDEAWRDAYARLEAVEGEAKPQEPTYNVKVWAESTCVECGLQMNAGQIRKCSKGGEMGTGHCTHHVPFAVRAAMERMVATPAAPPEVVEGLPPLEDDCNEDDVHLRAERWTARVFDIIDDGDAADGDAPNHAGIEAEWDLIQRERQLRDEIAAHAQTKAVLAEAIAVLKIVAADGTTAKDTDDAVTKFLGKIAATEGSK